jgi:hypothetical protein
MMKIRVLRKEVTSKLLNIVQRFPDGLVVVVAVDVKIVVGLSGDGHIANITTEYLQRNLELSPTLHI